MKETELRDLYGRIIGRIEFKDNGDKTLRDFYGRILGYYIKQQNVTKDFYGRVIAQGDCLTMLLK